MSVPSERPLALALVAALSSAIGANRAGYGAKPSGGGWASNTPDADTAFAGYAVVWPGQSLLEGGTVTDPNADAVQTVQVSYVGKTAEQADAIRDRGRAAILAPHAVTVAGRTIGLVELSDSQIVRRDDDVTPPLYLSADRYAIHSTP